MIKSGVTKTFASAFIARSSRNCPSRENGCEVKRVMKANVSKGRIMNGYGVKHRNVSNSLNSHRSVVSILRSKNGKFLKG